MLQEARWGRWGGVDEVRWCVRKMEVEDERSLFITKKKWGGWGAKPYGAARGGRKNVVPVRGKRKWVNLQSANDWKDGMDWSWWH